MNHDFPSSATRHLRAGRSLVVDCPDTAGYLFGYVAECSVKAVIKIAGMELKKHVDQLRSEHLFLAADLSLAARRYPVDLDVDLAKLRKIWSTDLRYSRTGSLSPLQANELLGQAENILRKTVHAMVLDGLIDEVPR